MDALRLIKLKIILLICYASEVQGDCGLPPQIPNTWSNSTDSASVTNGTAVRYSCMGGHKGQGERNYVCINGAWEGDFECLKICPFIEGLENGRITNRPSFVVASRITFECDPGYTLYGASSLLCRDDRKWRPGLPTCNIVSCGEFGGIANAYLFQKSLDGIRNVYGRKVEVTCDEGYVLQGASVVTCNADGRWGEKPQCRPSSCGSHAGWNSSCIMDTSLSDDGTFLTFLCKDNSDDVSVTQVGSGSAMCYEDEWDEPDMACYCDCKINANFTEVIALNLQRNRFLKHNARLDWKCAAGYRKASVDDIVCRDGNVETPQCMLIPTTTTTPQTTQPYVTSIYSSTTSDPLDPLEPYEGIPTGILVIAILGVLVCICLIVILVLWKGKLLCFQKQQAVPSEAKEELDSFQKQQAVPTEAKEELDREKIPMV